MIRWVLRIQGVAVTYREAFVATLTAELVLLVLFAMLQLLLA